MKVLFFHPTNYLEIGIPQGIAILSAILKKNGHEVELFDTTFLKTKPNIPEHNSKTAGPTIYKKTPYTLEDLVKDDPVVSIEKEFQTKIDNFKPHLVAVSTMTTNYDFAIEIIKKVKVFCPIIFGGIHPTLCPEEVISESKVDMICIGEGDDALPELCRAIESGKDYTNIRNLWVKSKNGKICKNGHHPFVNLDNLPCPDWSIFDPRHLYRPFMGDVYKGSFYISSRGCPSGCTYCVNRTLKELFKGCGRYFRYQSPETTISQLTELKKKYGATWFKFADDTFLLRPIENLKKLGIGLKSLEIHFGCSIRPNTITEEKVKLAKEMGCVAMSIGIETGNEDLSNKVLNRQISNNQIEKTLNIVNKYGLRVSTFNMIGLPGETRKNVFETIEFNRKLNVKAANVYIIYPFPGSQISIQYNKHYKRKNGRKNGSIIKMSDASVFHLSQMSPKEVEGLQRTFNLYLWLPKQLWPIIELAEDKGKQSDRIFDALNDFASTIV